MDTNNNPVLNDQYSLIHFLNGFFFYVLADKVIPYSINIRLLVWIILHGIYEFKDLYFSYIDPVDPKKTLYYGLVSNNSWQNSIADTIYSLLGFFVGYLLYSKVKNIELYKGKIRLISLISFIIISIIYYITFF